MQRFLDYVTDLRLMLLVQGDQPRYRLVELHRKRVANGEHSVLVGLQSFAEGLDLKGDLLSQVHIHKIAFPPIDSPVVITEGEWLKSLNRYPFEVQSLPSASFNLISRLGDSFEATVAGRSGYLRQTLADQKLWQATTGCITGISDRATGSP